MNRRLASLAPLALALACAAVPAAPRAPLPPTQPPLADRVLIVSVDGLGPAELRRVETPHLRALRARGASSLRALTTESVKTLPSHVSMLTGVTPQRHGVTWNDAFRRYPKSPTLFEAVERHRPELVTALVAGKPKFATLARPGSLDACFVPAVDGVSDEEVAKRAAAFIDQLRPNLLVVHLPTVDRTGHAKGWGSDEQLAAIARADLAVGTVLAALERAGLTEQTLVLLTADHGGLGRTHAASDGVSRTIPWSLAGPGVRAGVDLDAEPGEPIRTEDTFATACFVLGVPLDPEIDGRPVLRALRAAPGAELRE